MTLELSKHLANGGRFIINFLRTRSAKQSKMHNRNRAGVPPLLTAKRWEILKALCGAGPVSIREAARRVGRDVKAVHGDVTALIDAGLLDRAEGGGVEFPYEAIKVEFMLQAA
jgi:predicted transcriptional regulator